MELLIDVEVPQASPHRRLEVQVDLEPEVSVSDLIAALRDHIMARGVGPLPPAEELAAVAEPGERSLHPDDSVGATRLVSGETVALRRSRTPRAPSSDTPAPASRALTFSPPPPQPGFTPGHQPPRQPPSGSGQPPQPPPPPPPPPAGPPPAGQAPAPRHLAPPHGMPPGQPVPPGAALRAPPPPPPPPPPVAPTPPPPAAARPADWQPRVKLPPQSRPEPQPQPKPKQAIAVDVSTGPSAGMSKLLQPGSYAIGRGKACSIRLDDPTVSRMHLMVEVAQDLSVQVHADPDSTNGTWVDGEYLGGTRQVEPGQRIVIGATELSFWPVAPEESRIQDRLGQIPFNRVPYKRPVVQDRPFEALDTPPNKPEPRKIPFLASLLPLVAAIVMWQVTGRWFMLLFAGMSPIMMLVRARTKKKEGNLKYRRQREEFLEQLGQRVNQINESLAEERRERFTAAPDVAELARQAELHQPRLWERHRATADLLSLRLGLGDQKSLITQPMVKDGDMELREQAAEQLAHHTTVPHAPVVADLDELGATGLFHDYGQVSALGAALVTQAACLHSPEDLVIAAAVSPESLPSWAWLKWLPHTRTATSPLEGDHLVAGSDDLNRLMTNLLKVAAARFEGGKPPPGSGGFWPRVLVMIEEDADPDRAILAQLLDVAPVAGIRLLWLGRTEFQLPRQCQGIVRCVAGQEGLSTLRYTDPEIPDQHLMLEGITPQTALGIAKRLAPIRDASATSLTTAIPRKVLLLDAMGMPEPSRHEVVGRWAQPREYSLEFPLGVGADGQFTLDLVEHGPHALIAGTSGAGKSELLQTMVAALAANYPPERLNFLFIDYKGGAAAAPFEPLPHTVGAVTNLEAQLSMRALTSLRAELNRRMAVMEGRAKDLREMLEVAPEETPPSLVIVVDEFATLVKEIPDFVAGMVDIAQRGRSLGIHLVLATQRPTGAVNDNILANTNLRMSLRVLDPADSNSIIGTRDAADIPVPLRGRAYARSGPGAINPFQCAYSGAPFARKQVAAAVTVSPFPFGSHKPEADEAKPAQTAASAAAQPGAGDEEQAPPTHLEVVVSSCAEAARALDKPPPRRPWVEPLPEVVLLDDVVEQLGANVQSDPGRYAVLGLADQPEAQSQRPEIADLESSGGLLVFGTGGAGKTTALRTIAAGMAAQGDPDAVELYGLDFAGRSLKQLSDLPHTVSVATSDDLELITRMFTVLREEIEQRRELLAEHRAESLSALRRARGGTVVPRKIVLMDGYSNFHSTFDKSGDLFAWLQILQKLIADGRQVGIHGVFSTDRRQGLPSALFSAMGARLALRMSTPEELAQAGVPSKVAKEVNLADGRGYLNGTVELQVACVSEDPSGAAQADALHLLGKRVVERSSALPTPLPELPESITVDPMDPFGPLGSRPAPSTSKLRFPLGVTDLALDVAQVDLSRQNLVVTGPPMSGRSTALAAAAVGLAAVPEGPKLVAIGGSASPLAELSVWEHAGFSRSQVVPTLEAAIELVGDEESTEVKLVLFIDAMEDVDGPDRAKKLEQLAKSDQVRLAVAAEMMTLSKAYSGWAAELRRNRAVMVFQPGKGEVEQLTGMKPSLRPGQPMPAGRGVLVADRGWRLIQVSQPAELAR